MNKYRNKPTTVDKIRFDSKKEARRYSELKMLERAGMISELELQPKFKIVEKIYNMRARYYIADFRYIEAGQVVVEDVKSDITRKNPVYTLKKQLFLTHYGEKVTFRET